MRGGLMGRTTLSLDEEAVVAARELARREGLTLGEAVSRLVRRGAQQTVEERLPATGEFTLLGRRPGRQITSEDVYALLDED